MVHVPRKTINTFLLLLIIALNMYTILFPFWPKVVYFFQAKGNTQQSLSRIIHEVPAKTDTAGTRIIIPKMLLDEKINEAKSIATIRNDIWRRPNTSTPDRGSNTVLVGHRFTYANPNGVFYHLDKLQKNDEIALTWQGKRYVYEVHDIKTVEPSETNIEAPTNEDILTLYTCTPLWNPTKRLVVQARLEHIYE